MASPLDREEYIEQAYFFRALRERLTTNMAAQEILAYIHEEILATTRLPFAVQFLSTELRHSGLLSSGFARLPHYFTPFQTFVVKQAEEEGLRFNMQTALIALEREAQYRAAGPTPPGLFFYQFEVLSRNRLGYTPGLTAMGGDPLYDADWRDFLDMVHQQGGAIDFAEVIYLRSEVYVEEQRRSEPDYQPPVPALFGIKEGRIAKANRRYPDVPKPKPPDDLVARFETLLVKMREWETRLKLVEGELRGQVDLSQFGKPEILREQWKKEKDEEV
jgi:hypothetical protein